MFEKNDVRRPKVGLGVILHKNGKVLAGMRKNSHAAGTWGFPGGHIEWNESFEDCALRELKEETGIIGKNPRFVSATNDILALDDQHYVTIFMLVEDFDGEPQVLEPEKCAEWRWFDWDDLPDQKFTPIDNLIDSGFHPNGSNLSINEYQVVRRTKKMIKEKFTGEGSGHDWWHVYRVWKNAKTIAKHEDVNQFVVELGALLHDVADWKDHDGDLEAGPRETRKWLEVQNVDSQIIEQVVEVVRDVSYKGGNVADVKSSLELDVVRDADRLDAMGAIGIGRAFTWGGSRSRPMYEPDDAPKLHASAEHYYKDKSHTINHFHEKLFLLKDRMGTETGKKMAESRHEFLEVYFDQFMSEWNGEDGLLESSLHKLVRDRIPEIIEESGDHVRYRIADSDEYRTELKKKLLEEVHEYLSDETSEELADVLEVVRAIAEVHGVTSQDLEKIRSQKHAERGSFSNRIILEETW